MSTGAPPGGPSFAALAGRLRDAAGALGGTLESMGDLEGYPFLRLAFGPPDGLPLLVDAGLHGEEPASALGLAAWLEADAPRRAAGLRVTALPCLNPWGFERGLRRSRDAEDPNRRFDEPDAPLTRLVTAAAGGRRYTLAMDLHEDCDFSALYCYELKAGPPFLGEAALAAAAAQGVALSHGEAVGAFTTDRGRLRPPADAAVMRERRGWPIAFFHFTRLTDYVVTWETPGRLPLDRRIVLQRGALNAAADFLRAAAVL